MCVCVCVCEWVCACVYVFKKNSLSTHNALREQIQLRRANRRADSPQMWRTSLERAFLDEPSRQDGQKWYQRSWQTFAKHTLCTLYKCTRPSPVCFYTVEPRRVSLPRMNCWPGPFYAGLCICEPRPARGLSQSSCVLGIFVVQLFYSWYQSVKSDCCSTLSNALGVAHTIMLCTLK